MDNLIFIKTCSQAGSGHGNEDVIGYNYLNDGSVICALADGQGGQGGGAAAAQIAVSKVLDQASLFEVPNLLKPGTWNQIAEGTDKAVQQSPDAGFCTLVSLVCTPDLVVGVSNGDSAALLVVDGVFHVLTSRQHKNPPVGFGAAAITTFSCPLGDAWKILVMSDGVWKYLGWEMLQRTLLATKFELICDHLLQSMKQEWSNGLPDDFSLILVASSK